MSDGLGITGSDIFIRPSLVAEYLIEDGQSVSGTAVLNFNKKREQWGWKAISLVREGAALTTRLDDAANELIWLALRTLPPTGIFQPKIGMKRWFATPLPTP